MTLAMLNRYFLRPLPLRVLCSNGLIAIQHVDTEIKTPT
jgi:hypothetical protein